MDASLWTAVQQAVKAGQKVHIELTIEPPNNGETKPTITDTHIRDPPHNESTSFALLSEQGVEQDTALLLARNHTPQRIAQVIEAAENQGHSIKNKPGYIRRALENGWHKKRAKRR